MPITPAAYMTPNLRAIRVSSPLLVSRSHLDECIGKRPHPCRLILREQEFDPCVQEDAVIFVDLRFDLADCFGGILVCSIKCSSKNATSSTRRYSQIEEPSTLPKSFASNALRNLGQRFRPGATPKQNHVRGGKAPPADLAMVFERPLARRCPKNFMKFKSSRSSAPLFSVSSSVMTRSLRAYAASATPLGVAS